MFKRIVLFLIPISLIAIISGCGAYYPIRLPSNYVEDYANSVKLKDVSVVVKFFDCDDAKETFGCNMCTRKVQPVFILINNKSNVAYGFRKANIDSNYIYAEKAAKKCARNKIIHGGPWPPLYVRIHKINDNIRKDYLAKEIVDVYVEPGRILSGVIFINPFKSGEKLNIPLINRKDGKRLVFEFQKP